MALTEEWIQLAFEYAVTLCPPDDTFKMSESGHISRAAIDGVLVIYDFEDTPIWLQQVLDDRDEDGNVERQVEAG